MATEEITLIPSGTFYRNKKTQEVLRIEYNLSDNKNYLCTAGRVIAYTFAARTDNILKNWSVITNEEILFNGSKIKIGPEGLEIKNIHEDINFMSPLDFEVYKPGLCKPHVLFIYNNSEATYLPHICFGITREPRGLMYFHTHPLKKGEKTVKVPVNSHLFAYSTKADSIYRIKYYWDPTRNIVGYSVYGSSIFYAYEMCGEIFTNIEDEGFDNPSSSSWVEGIPSEWKPSSHKIFYRNEKNRETLVTKAKEFGFSVNRVSDEIDRVTKENVSMEISPAPKDIFGNYLQPVTDINPLLQEEKPFVLYIQKQDASNSPSPYVPYVVLGYVKDSTSVFALRIGNTMSCEIRSDLVTLHNINEIDIAVNPTNHFQRAVDCTSKEGSKKETSSVIYVKDKRRGILGVMDPINDTVHYSVCVDGKVIVHFHTKNHTENWEVVDPRTAKDTRKPGAHLCENMLEYQTMLDSIQRVEKHYKYYSNFQLELIEDAAVFADFDKIVAEMSTTSVDYPGIETKNNRPPNTPSVVRKSTMSKMTETLKSDGKEAAIRVAARQGTKIVVEPLAALLCRHLGDDSPEFRAKVGRFLQTDLGRAIAMGAFSAGLSALPLEGNHKDAIARELRVEAMAMLGDELAEVFIKPLREVTALYLKGFPQEEAPLEELPSGEVLSHASEGQEIGVVEKSLPVVRLVSRLNPSTSRLRGFS